MDALIAYKTYKKEGNVVESEKHLTILMDNFEHFGYSYVDEPNDIVPSVSIVFYSFHIMVILGTLFVFIFLFFAFNESNILFNFTGIVHV